MLVSSKTFPDSTARGKVDTLVLKRGARQVLVILPKTFEELLAIARKIFGISEGIPVVVETSDLDICQGAAIEIHDTAWEAVALTLSSVSVEDRSLNRSREHDKGVFQPSYTRGPSSVPKISANATPGPSTHGYRVAHSAGVSVPPRAPTANSDDISDSLQTDDLAGDDNGFDDDEENLPPPIKGKARSHARIESDGDGEEEHQVESLVSAKPSQASISTHSTTERAADSQYRPRSPLSPRASVAVTPSRASAQRTARDLFSPRADKSARTRDDMSDQEQEELFAPPTVQPVRGFLVDEPSHLERASKETVPKPTPSKSVQPPQVPTKFKPQLKASVPPTPEPLPVDKLLITIRHPPTEKENRFKVKATHSVGRVLASACTAFGMDPNGATMLLWTEEDGVEMSYPCENHETMGNVASEGTVFIIELEK
ncbi:hypothetical protein BC834DRAFT_884335 [Gloeopeniophorella convolvens]|nr:hypothetical protein BC834DRAFT_884335 [Gloeopeniophorella convolvens]